MNLEITIYRIDDVISIISIKIPSSVKNASKIPF